MHVWSLAAHLLHCLARISLSPSEGWYMGINLMVVIHGEYSACSTLQVDSKVNCSLAYELAATWC